mgnify:CR=1 FL=1
MICLETKKNIPRIKYIISGAWKYMTLSEFINDFNYVYIKDAIKKEK